MRVAIVDDHQLFVDGLVSWLAVEAPDVVITYAGPDHRSALREGNRPDAVILDLDLGPDAPAIPDLVHAFTNADVPVIVVSALMEARFVRQAMRAGAYGFVPKREPSTVLLAALRAVASGDEYFVADLAAILMQQSDEIPAFSPQELNVLRLYASGLKLEAVARRLDISPSTAREYLKRIRSKYADVGRGARTKTELYAAATHDRLLAGGDLP